MSTVSNTSSEDNQYNITELTIKDAKNVHKLTYVLNIYNLVELEIFTAFYFKVPSCLYYSKYSVGQNFWRGYIM